MDLYRILNTPRPQRIVVLLHSPRTPRILIRKSRARETTRSNYIYIKTALEQATPHSVWRKYKDEYSFTLHQIRLIQQNPITPQKKTKVRRKPTILVEKVTQLKEQLLAHPAHRHVSFYYLPTFALELGLEEYGFEAIRTAFKSLRYSRRVAKRKGFLDGLVHIVYRVAFVKEGLTQSRERLYLQCFLDEVWVYRGAFT